MKKSMKSNLKKVVVKCLDWTEDLEVDANIFEDVFMEAATRVLEKHKDTPNFTVSVGMQCCEKKHEKIPSKYTTYNVYFVLVNAAMYEKAELLRLNFLKSKKIDLQKESIKSDESGSYKSTGPDTQRNN